MKTTMKRLVMSAVALAIMLSLTISALAASGTSVKIPWGAVGVNLGTQGVSPSQAILVLTIPYNSDNCVVYVEADIAGFMGYYGAQAIVTGSAVWSVASGKTYSFVAFNPSAYDTYISYSSSAY